MTDRLPEGARVLPTAALRNVAERLSMVELSACKATMWGDSGVGKTLAIRNSLTAGDGSQQLIRFPTPTPAGVLTELLAQLTGSDPPRSSRLVRRMLVDQLAETRLLVVDDAQRLSRDGRDLLYELHEQLPVFGLVLVGDSKLPRKLDGNVALRESIDDVLVIRPLSPEDVVLEIPNYHPLYRDADLHLLLELDRDYARGNFRRWSHITSRAVVLCAARGLTTLDRATATQILRELRQKDDDLRH